MGLGAVHDLAAQSDVDEITIADSDIAKHEAAKGVVRLPRKLRGEVIATSASDACGRFVTWFKQQQADMRRQEGIAEVLLFEPVAVIEVVPTHAELLALAEQMEAEERARRWVNSSWVDLSTGPFEVRTMRRVR